MLVTVDNYFDMLRDIETSTHIGLDTETYGINFDDKMFSLIFATENKSYYMNFNADEDHLGNKAPVVLSKALLQGLEPHFLDYQKTWISHNASFDLQKIWIEQIRTPIRVHCTYITERIIRNDSLDLSLSHLAPMYNEKKDSRVEEYIKEHKLYTMVQVPGKDKKEKVPHFDKVPFKLMSEYGENDAIIHRRIGLKQIAKLTTGLSQRDGTDPCM